MPPVDTSATGRLVIVGGPRTGKTTLARELDPKARSTDDLMGSLGWSEASAEVARWFDAPAFVVEGVAVARAARKWLAAHPTGKPFDRAIFLSRAHEPRTPGQESMAKGVATVWAEIAGELRARGVVLEER